MGYIKVSRQCSPIQTGSLLVTENRDRRALVGVPPGDSDIVAAILQGRCLTHRRRTIMTAAARSAAALAGSGTGADIDSACAADEAKLWLKLLAKNVKSVRSTV